MLKRVSIGLFVLLLILTGCGQKRALYLPKPVKVPDVPSKNSSLQSEKNQGELPSNPDGL